MSNSRCPLDDEHPGFGRFAHGTRANLRRHHEPEARKTWLKPWTKPSLVPVPSASGQGLNLFDVWRTRVLALARVVLANADQLAPPAAMLLSPPMPISRRPLALAVVVALVTTGCDLSSKQWAIRTTALGPRPIIPGALDLVHWENPAMAFSLMRSWPPGIRMALLCVAAVTAIAVGLFLVAQKPMRASATVALGLIMGGALGNFIDRAQNGTVTRFPAPSPRVLRLARVQRGRYRGIAGGDFAYSEDVARPEPRREARPEPTLLARGPCLGLCPAARREKPSGVTFGGPMGITRPRRDEPRRLAPTICDIDS